MPGKQVTHRASRYTKECASSDSIEKSAYNHRLNVFGHGTWYQPYEEECERANVDPSSAIELSKISLLAITVGLGLG